MVMKCEMKPSSTDMLTTISPYDRSTLLLRINPWQ